MPVPEPRAVLHVVASFAESDGGPARYIADLCGHLAGRGVAVGVLTAAPARGATIDVGPGVEVRALPAAPGVPEWIRARAFHAAALEWIERHPGGLLHLHGLWRLGLRQAAAAGRRRRCPVVWAPMGMLEPWALRHHGWRKRLAWWSYQRSDLAAAAALHATSPLEAEGIRRVRLRPPVAVIPLGVDVPGQPSARNFGLERTALFLSRIHPKKGLLDLLAAWARLDPPGWRLRIAGPDEAGHAAEVAAYIRSHRLRRVTIEGPLWGDAKAAAYATADLFVLPSHSENFGLVVAEALAAAVPVITTRATPWQQLPALGCGWCVEPGTAALLPALRDAVRLPPAELAAMGGRGRAWIGRACAWPQVTTEFLGLYRWLAAGTGAPPAALHFS